MSDDYIIEIIYLFSYIKNIYIFFSYCCMDVGSYIKKTQLI